MKLLSIVVALIGLALLAGPAPAQCPGGSCQIASPAFRRPAFAPTPTRVVCANGVCRVVQARAAHSHAAARPVFRPARTVSRP